MTAFLSVLTEFIRLALYLQTAFFVILPAASFFGGKGNPIAYFIEAVCDFWKRPAEILLGRFTARHPGNADKAALLTLSVLFVIARTLPAVL